MWLLSSPVGHYHEIYNQVHIHAFSVTVATLFKYGGHLIKSTGCKEIDNNLYIRKRLSNTIYFSCLGDMYAHWSK